MKKTLIMKTTSYLLISILLFGIVLCKSTYSQEFNSNEIKTIHKKVDSLLQAYKLSNTFTEDDKQISQKYIDSFKKLFGDKKDQRTIMVFNDIEKMGYLEKKISLSEYIKSVKVFYEEGGLGISIRDITYEKPVLIRPHEDKIYMSPNEYKIDVNLKKRVFGFFQNKNTYDETFDMIITITFNKRKKGFCDFIIQGVNSSETFLVEGSKISKYEVGFLFMPTYTRIDSKAKSGNSYISTHPKAGFHLNLNLLYYYFLYEDIKIGTGIGFGISKYKTNLTSKTHSQSPYSFKDIIDELNLSFFDVSVYLIKFKNYKWLNNIKWLNKFELTASLGFNFSFPMSKKFTTSGYKNDVKYNYNDNIKASAINICGFGQLGISKPIINNLSINAGINYIYGLSNISGYDKSDKYFENTTTDKYNSLIVLGSKTHTQMFGVYFGLSYKL